MKLSPDSLHNILSGTREQLREAVPVGNTSFIFIDIRRYKNTLPSFQEKLFLCSLHRVWELLQVSESGNDHDLPVNPAAGNCFRSGVCPSYEIPKFLKKFVGRFQT